MVMSDGLNSKFVDTMIIGAGITGLTVAATLKAHNLDYMIVDSADEIGHSWSERHPQLRLNTHRLYSSMPHAQYEAKTKSFPSRNDVVNHLRNFTEQNKIDVLHGTKVLGVNDVGDSRLVISTNKGQYETNRVIFCTGLDALPRPFSVQGIEAFKGRVLHSRDLGDIADYAAKNVLVIGGGNSGFDILNHLSRSKASSVFHSVRGMSPLLPKRIWGVSTHLFAALLNKLPEPLSDRIIQATQNIAFGPLEKLGYPKAGSMGVQRLKSGRAIAIDDGAIKAVRRGKIEVIDEIAQFKRYGAITKNGMEIEFDIVIHANGYDPAIAQIDGLEPYLDNCGQPKTDKNGRSKHGGKVWFAGHYPTIMSFFHTAKFQARAFAKQIMDEKSEQN